MTEQRPRRLLDQVRDAIRLKHYSIRTEEAYVNWIRRYILFHNKRHHGLTSRRCILSARTGIHLDVTGCCFAPPSRRDTTLPWPGRQDRQHSQSPDCTGCLPRGLLTVTTTGLAPASRRQLS